MIDEKIALLEKAKRQEDREQLRKQEQAEEETKPEEKLTVEAARAGIAAGELVIGKQKYQFVKKNYLSGKIDWYDIVDRLEEKTDQTEEGDEIVLLSGIQDYVQIYLTSIHQPGKKTTMKEQTETAKKAFNELGMFVRIEKRHEGEHFDYFTYFLPSGKGNIYGINYWQKDGKRQIIGSMTCLYKEKDTMGTLMEAMIEEIRVTEE